MSVTIFLSAVSDEFLAYRDELRSDLTRHNVEVKIQEDFKDYGGPTLEKLDLYISTVDAVIHLVGDMTGSDPTPTSVPALLAKYPDFFGRIPQLREPLEQGHAISYTQWEAWLALYHNKLLVIAEADQAAPRGPKYVSTDASRTAQKEHLGRLRGFERFGNTFTSPDNLAKNILGSAILDLLTKAKQEQAVNALPSFPYSSLIALLFLTLLTPLYAAQLAKALGVSLAAPLSLVSAIGGFALALIYWRYLGVLGAGAEPLGSLERRSYDSLRESLVRGGIAVRLYSRWLTSFLNAVDRFFGDAAMADRTLFPHAFGLRTPAPLWTAPAFDRCLLLALLYPIITIFSLWALSGHIGPAEQALGISPIISAWQRGVVITTAWLGALAIRQYVLIKGWKSFIWIIATGACACAAFVAGHFGSENLVELSGISIIVTFIAAVAFATAVAVSATATVVIQAPAARDVAYNVAGSIAIVAIVVGTLDTFAQYPGAFGVAYAIVGAVAGAGAIAIAVAIAAPALMLLRGRPEFLVLIIAGPVIISYVVALLTTAVGNRWRGIFLSLFSSTMLGVCLVSASLLSLSHGATQISGPPLLFLGLLTLLNAPFNWVALGLTRALLRRGLELKGWWPYLLALVDAVTAGAILALLAVTMVIGVQAFDDLAARGGGTPVLPLELLFDGIADHPGSPEFWWVYVLLLSTRFRILINLMLGGTAIMRSVPGLSSLLLPFLPSDRAAPTYDRAWIALVLTLQAAGGVLLGIVAQALLAVGLILYAMPAVGLELLGIAREIAAFDLPARILLAF